MIQKFCLSFVRPECGMFVWLLLGVFSVVHSYGLTVLAAARASREMGTRQDPTFRDLDRVRDVVRSLVTRDGTQPPFATKASISGPMARLPFAVAADSSPVSIVVRAAMVTRPYRALDVDVWCQSKVSGWMSFSGTSVESVGRK